MSDEVGKITLVLEIRADIESQLHSITNRIAQDMREMLSTTFNSGQRQIDEMARTSRQIVERMNRDIQNSVSRTMNSVGRNSPRTTRARFNRPIENAREDNGERVRTDSTRTPPTNNPRDTNNLYNTSDEYREISNFIEETTRKLNRLIARQIKYEELGVSRNSRQWRSLAYDIDEVTRSVEHANAELRELRGAQSITNSVSNAPSRGLTPAPVTPAPVTQAVSTRNNQSTPSITNSARNIPSGRLTAAPVSPALMNGFNRIGESATRQMAPVQNFSNLVRRTFANLKANGIKGIVSQIKNFGSSIKGVVGKVRIFANGVKSVIGKLGSLGSRAIQSAKKLTLFNSTAKKMGGISKGVMGGLSKLGNILKMMMLYAGIRAVLNGIKEGFNNLVKYSDKTNKSASNLKSSFTQLKNSMATAFEPVFNAIAPAITFLIDCLSRAFTTIAQFTAALTGATTFTRAKKVQQDYAKSLGKTGEAAKEAKGELASFDKINNMSSKDSSGGGSTELSAGDMFETVEIDSQIKSLGDTIKNMFKEGQFSELGEMLGNQINVGLQKINDFIKWDNIGKSITKSITGITDFINSVVSTVDWTLLGNTIAQGFNTVVNTIYEFVTRIDWGNIGNAIANSLNGMIHGIDWEKLGNTIGTSFMSAVSLIHNFIKTFDFAGLASSFATLINNTINSIDWKEVGKTVSDSIKGILEFFKTGIAEIDWYQLGKSISNFLGSIDYTGIIKDLAEIIGKAIGGLALLLWGAIEDSVKAIGKYFSDKIEECGGNVAKGLLKGILDGVVGIAKWLKNNVIDPIINGVKSMFGIHSPSTVFAEIGKNLIDGMIKGIKDIANNVVTKFTEIRENIKKVFVDVQTWFSEKFTDVRKKLITAFSLSTIKLHFDNVLKDIKNVFETVQTWFSKKFKTVKDNLTSAFSLSDIKKHFNDVLEDIKSVFSGVADWFKNTFTSAWKGVKDVFSTGGKIFTGITDGIAKTFKAVVDKLIDGINDIIAKPFDAINGMLNKIRNTGLSIAGIECKPFVDKWKENPLPVPQIPHLAQGGFVKKNTPQLALIGDNRHQGEVVAPENKLLEMAKLAANSSDSGLSLELLSAIRKNNRLLEMIAAKETSVNISERDIYNANNRQSLRNYKANNKLQFN